MRKRILFFCLLLFGCLSAHSQQQNTYLDSLQRILLEKSYPEKGLVVVEELKKKEISIDDKISLLEEEISKLEEMDAYPLQLTKFYAYLGDLYRGKRKYELGTPYILKAKELANKYGDGTKGWSQINGVIHDFMSFKYYWEFDSEKAIEEAETALRFFQAAADTMQIAKTYNSLGIRYSEAGDRLKALEYYEKAMVYFKQLNSEPWLLRANYCKVVDLLGLERFEEARLLLIKILPRMEATEHVNYHPAHTKLGQIEMHMGNYAEAERLMLMSLENARETNNWNSITVATNELVRLYEEKGDYKNAFEYFRLKCHYSDSLFIQTNNQQNVDAQAKYEELGNVQKIKELEYLATIQDSRFRTWIASLTGLFIIALLSIGFCAYRQSQRKRQALLLAKKDKEVQLVRERLLSSITHELRTPLTLIIGKTDELVKRKLDKTSYEFASSANRNAEELLTQVNQLLDWNRVEAKAMKLEVSVGNVMQVLNESFDQIKGVSISKKMNWSIDLPSDQLMGEIDFKKLKTIVTNLLTNAFKYTPENGSIHLSSEILADEQLKISVKDNGPGIPIDKIEKVFDWYYRAQDQKEEVATPGFGVGLALSRELALLMGGQLNLNSNEGNGSTFSLLVPFKKIKELYGSPTPHISVASQTLKTIKPLAGKNKKPLLLLIEDHFELAEHIAQVVSKQYKVITTQNAYTGMEIALDKVPDIIITDLMLPGKNGLDFCLDLKSNMITDHIPVLILTARTEQATKLKGLRNQADAFMTKPFKSDELLLTLNNLIQNRRRLHLRYQMQEKESVKKMDPFIELLMSTIKENFSDNHFNVDAFAQKLKISRVQLFKKTKALVGASPSGLIKQYRLESAKNLLESRDYSVSEIAYKCGFSTPEYFSTVFKDHYKMSPTQLMKKF